MYLWGESAYVKAIISQYVYNVSILSHFWQKKKKKRQFIKEVFLVALSSFHNAAEHCYRLYKICSSKCYKFLF